MLTMQSFYEKVAAVDAGSDDVHMCMIRLLTKLTASQVKAIAEGLGWQGW